MLLQIKNGSKMYQSGDQTIYALNHLSLEIGRGEFVSIVGCSGSGKSTLMNVLGCLDTLSEGNYTLDGKDVSQMNERQLSRIRNRTIGFIFQSFYLIPSLTALENVELPLIYSGIPPKRCQILAYRALKQVGLASRIHHRPGQMSGGQQQRVAIARALASSPAIILADEPTGNLDRNSGKEVMQLLRQLHRDGRTIVLITHDNAIAQQAERILTISDGKLISDSSQKIFQKTPCANH